MGINRIGTQSILKKRLEDYMNYLDQDDKVNKKKQKKTRTYKLNFFTF